MQIYLGLFLLIVGLVIAIWGGGAEPVVASIVCGYKSHKLNPMKRVLVEYSYKQTVCRRVVYIFKSKRLRRTKSKDTVLLYINPKKPEQSIRKELLTLSYYMIGVGVFLLFWAWFYKVNGPMLKSEWRRFKYRIKYRRYYR